MRASGGNGTEPFSRITEGVFRSGRVMLLKITPAVMLEQQKQSSLQRSSSECRCCRESPARAATTHCRAVPSMRSAAPGAPPGPAEQHGKHEVSTLAKTSSRIATPHASLLRFTALFMNIDFTVRIERADSHTRPKRESNLSGLLSSFVKGVRAGIRSPPDEQDA